MNPDIVGDRVRELMKVKQIKRIYLARKLDMSYNTLTQKLIGNREFGLNDMLKIKQIFHLNNEDCAEIFFGEEFDLSKFKKREEAK